MTNTANQLEDAPRSHFNRIDPVDALRVLAVFYMVFFTHAWIFSNDPLLPASDFPATFLLKSPAWAGVWVLLIVSGFLLGKGFYVGRYSLSAAGLRKYFTGRILRIAPPYLLFCAIIGLFVFPGFFTESPWTLLRILTFTYNGDPGVTGIGATWYVSTAMQLYALSPLVYVIARRIRGRALLHVAAIVALAGIGLGLRLWARELGIAWYNGIYTASYMNIDLFAGGMLVGGLTHALSSREFPRFRLNGFRAASAVTLLGLVAVNSYLYFYGELGNSDYIFAYQYLLPTAYLLAVGVYLLLFNLRSAAQTQPLDVRHLRVGTAAAISGLSAISYEFYLWHSNVLAAVFPLVPRVHSPLVTHGIKLIVGAAITLGIASLMQYLMREPIRALRRRASTPDAVSSQRTAI